MSSYGVDTGSNLLGCTSLLRPADSGPERGGPRPQHLVLLLADWMSAIVLQAVFYGKSQFGVRQKVSRRIYRFHWLPAILCKTVWARAVV